jgi:hypothetical protein
VGLQFFLVALLVGCCPKPPSPKPPITIIDRDCLGPLKPPAELAVRAVACSGNAVACFDWPTWMQILEMLDEYRDYVDTSEARCRPHERTP